MKNNMIFLCLLALNLVTLDCRAQKVNETAVTFLCDATDQAVFNAIESDFNQNLNTFFTNTGIGTINFGQRLTIRMGAIDESDQLSLQSRSIALTDKRVSKKDAERQRNPRPLLEMISAELARYKQLSERTMTSSPIIDVTLKVFYRRRKSKKLINILGSNNLILFVDICTDYVVPSSFSKLRDYCC